MFGSERLQCALMQSYSKGQNVNVVLHTSEIVTSTHTHTDTQRIKVLVAENFLDTESFELWIQRAWGLGAAESIELGMQRALRRLTASRRRVVPWKGDSSVVRYLLVESTQDIFGVPGFASASICSFSLTMPWLCTTGEEIVSLLLHFTAIV